MSNLVGLVNRKIQCDGIVYTIRRGEHAPDMPDKIKELFKSSGYIGGKNRKPKPRYQGNREEVIIDPEQHIIEEEQVFNDTFRKEDTE